MVLNLKMLLVQQVGMEIGLTGDIISVALDMDNHRVYFAKKWSICRWIRKLG